MKCLANATLSVRSNLGALGSNGSFVIEAADQGFPNASIGHGARVPCSMLGWMIGSIQANNDPSHSSCLNVEQILDVKFAN